MPRPNGVFTYEVPTEDVMADYDMMMTVQPRRSLPPGVQIARQTDRDFRQHVWLAIGDKEWHMTFAADVPQEKINACVEYYAELRYRESREPDLEHDDA